MSRLARRLGPWLVALAVAAGALAGCAREDAGAWVERAAADSAAAEQAERGGRPDVAAERLRAIVEREVPRGVAESDARVVRQDAYDRLARLALEEATREEGALDRAALDRAMSYAERGLALGESQDIFTASLLTTRGRVHEAAGRDREAAGDYARALAIDEALLERALGGEGR